MSSVLEGIKFIGSLAGLISLGWVVFWALFEAHKGYLKVRVQVDNNAFSVLTEIENSSKWKDKKIDNAFLIVAPENFNILEAGQQIAEHFNIDPHNIEGTENFEPFNPAPPNEETPFYIGRRIGFIPLPFYYSENIRIGDEKLTYRCSVDSNQLDQGRYSIRFFIYAKGRLHRSTQDLLSING